MRTTLENKTLPGRPRTHWLAVLTAVIISLAASIAMPPLVRADEPLRSGSILAVHADTSEVTWLWPWPGCNGAVACWAWTKAGCPEEMVGLDPAATSSIELVSDLADGVTPRTLEFHRATPAGLATGDVVVEFWYRGCRQIQTDSHGFHLFCSSADCPKFPIPKRAHWMTITSKPGNANIEWSLN
jgi:hypothetical protein